MNTCPVYRRSGGLSYGATYSGPIGLIIDPTSQRQQSAFRLDLERQLQQRLPGQDQHPRADLWLAPRAREAARGHVRQEKRDEGGWRIAVPARRNRRRQCGARASAAVGHLQRSKCLGEASRSAPSAETDVPQLVSDQSRRKEMSSRDDILAAVRANLPRVDRPLPSSQVLRLGCGDHESASNVPRMARDPCRSPKAASAVKNPRLTSITPREETGGYTSIFALQQQEDWTDDESLRVNAD